MADGLLLMLGKCPKYKKMLNSRGYFWYLIVMVKKKKKKGLSAASASSGKFLGFLILKADKPMVPPLSPFIDGFINHCYPHPGSQVSDEYFGISSVVTLYNKAKAQKNQKNKQSEI